MESFSTHSTVTGCLGLPCWGSAGSSPLAEASRSAESRLGWSESKDSTYSGARQQLFTWNLSPPTPLHQAAWGDPAGALQAAGPLAEASRSAESRLGQSEQWDSTYSGARQQLFTWNLSPPIPLRAHCARRPKATLWGFCGLQPL